MKVYFIRHSEPDYGPVTTAGLTGFGRDLCPLTPRGILLAQKLAQDTIFKRTQLILCSPYTRTLQTATEIIRVNNLPLKVELDLHEWQPDKSGTDIANPQQVRQAYQEYQQYGNTTHPNNHWNYETPNKVKQRVARVLQRYQSYDYIACVTHSEVMRQFGEWKEIEYCEIKTFNTAN